MPRVGRTAAHTPQIFLLPWHHAPTLFPLLHSPSQSLELTLFLLLHSPCCYTSLNHDCVRQQLHMQWHAHLHASTTVPEVKRHGSGAYLVAMIGRVFVSRMNSPRNCSLRPKPYTCNLPCFISTGKSPRKCSLKTNLYTCDLLSSTSTAGHRGKFLRLSCLQAFACPA